MAKMMRKAIIRRSRIWPRLRGCMVGYGQHVEHKMRILLSLLKPNWIELFWWLNQIRLYSSYGVFTMPVQNEDKSSLYIGDNNPHMKYGAWSFFLPDCPLRASKTTRLEFRVPSAQPWSQRDSILARCEETCFKLP